MLLSTMHWRLLLVLSMSLMVLTACAKTAPNMTETTAPTLTWKVQEDNNSPATYTGNANITANLGTSFIVTLIADDTGGVRQITLGSSTHWTCTNGNGISSSGSTLDSSPTVINSSPDSNNQVPTSLEWPRNFSLGYDCPNRYTLTSISQSLFGSGTNYANRKAQATLTIHL